MDSTRSWFHKFKPISDKSKSSPTKKKETKNGKHGKKLPIDEAPSNITKQKVAAAKLYIENHYKSQMKCLQERKERKYMAEVSTWNTLYNQLQPCELPKQPEQHSSHWAFIEVRPMEVRN